MKKIFAISFLSVFAVVGVARAEYVGYYASGTDVNQNYNLASVNFVKGRYDEAVEKAKRLVITSDKKTTVAGDRYFYEQTGSDEKAPTIKYMENSIAEAVADIDMSTKVDKTSVVSSTGTVTSDDTQIPTIKRMESAIANAKPDTSGLVDKAAVVVSGGGRTMTGGAVATDANKDAYVPTVAYAQEMATSAASEAVAELEPKIQERVPYATGIGDGFLVTDSTGNVYVNHGVPSSISDAMDEKISVKLDKPIGECAEIGACALVFAGFGENGAPLLQWEKIARSVIQTTAE